MSFSLDISNTRSLSNLQKHEIIEYESSHVDKDIFMVFDLDKEPSIPALLLQLWKFDGGYDHSCANVMENDLRVNNQVRFFEPRKINGKISQFSVYRPEESGLTEKEEYFFDVWPESKSKEKDDKHQIPFKAIIDTEDGQEELILPAWTPLQRLPLERIKEGTIVEIWQVQEIKTVMRVLKI